WRRDRMLRSSRRARTEFTFSKWLEETALRRSRGAVLFLGRWRWQAAAGVICCGLQFHGGFANDVRFTAKDPKGRRYGSFRNFAWCERLRGLGWGAGAASD